MNLLRKIAPTVLALMFLFVLAVPLFAQPPVQPPATTTVSNMPQPFGSPAWGAGIGAGLVIIGAAMGFGRIGVAALESMARQPETAGRVQTAMIIIGALLEGATFFALIVCIQVAGRAS